MAVRQGYGKIAGTDALLFAYDTGDTRNSYRGKPATNLLPEGVAATHDAASGNVVTVTDATSEKGPGWKKVTITTRGTNFRTLQWTYLNMSANTTYCHSAVLDWGNMRGKNYFIYFDGNGTGTRTYYYPGDYATPVVSNIDSSMPDGKFAGTITHTSEHTHAFFIGNYTTSTSGLNDYFYYKEFQAEIGTYPTQYTSGTRSSTQGLVDLTGNKTITLSNISFDTNAQLTFDGTNDTLDTGIALTDLPALSNFTIECIAKIDAYPSAASPNFYNNTTKCGVLVGAAYYSGTALYWYGNSSGTACTIYAYIRGADAYRTAGGFDLTPGKYHHLVLVNDSTNSILRLYANGTLNGSATTATQQYNSGLAASAGNIGISKPQVDGGGEAVYSYFDGDVPTTKIYNRALTADEVRNNYRHYKTRYKM